MLRVWMHGLSGWVDEPATMLTDYAVGIACVVFAVSVWRSLPPDRARATNPWFLSFVAVMLAAFVGGTMHGFDIYMSPPTARWFELVTAGLIVVTIVLFIVASLTSVFPPRPGRWLLGGLVLTVVGLGILASPLEPDPAFTRVDVYHCVQLAGLYCFARGARGVGHGAGRYRRRQLMALLRRLQTPRGRTQSSGYH